MSSLCTRLLVALSATLSAAAVKECEIPADGAIPDCATIHDFLRPTTECTDYIVDKEALYPPAVDSVRYNSQTAPKNLQKLDVFDASEMTPEKFGEYVSADTPVLIRNARQNMMEDGDYTPEGLMKSKYVNTRQPVVRGSGRLLSTNNYKMSIKELWEAETRAVTFVSYYCDELDETTYWRPNPALLHQEYLRKLKDSNDILKVNPKTAGKFTLHCSNQGGGLPHNHGEAFNIALYGAKRWILVGPKNYDKGTDEQDKFELMDVQPWGSDVEYTSQEWFRDVVLEGIKYEYYDFIQEEGDAVFVPKGWTHATIDVCRETVGIVLSGKSVTGKVEFSLAQRAVSSVGRGNWGSSSYYYYYA